MAGAMKEGLAASIGVTQRKRSEKRKKSKSTGSLPQDPSHAILSYLLTVYVKNGFWLDTV